MTIHAITVPKWGIEMQEATLAEWKVDVGAAVAKGDEIVDMETEKIVNTHEAPAAGVLRKKLAEPGDVYEVGKLIGVISDADESDEAIDQFVAAFVPVDASFEGSADDQSAEATPESDAPPPPTSTDASGEPRISPIAKRLAESLNVEWRSIQGTGRNGRISKQDVEAAAAANASGGPLPRSALQKTVAARMQLAKQEIPHFYLEISIDVGRAQTLRRSFNNDNGVKITLNDLIVRAVADTLAKHPNINVQYREDELFPAGGDIGVAVAAKDGLVAPVVKSAAGQSLQSLAAEIRRLAVAANERSLEAHDLVGGATTVSNLGMFGVDGFTAIINPPQTSIIAVGAAKAKPSVRDGEPHIAEAMRVTMSCDHRAFDGAAGAAFLSDLRTLLEAPHVLFADA
ncbi:MAG: dihydrolipoamide acetyltransferase family protein [Pseudomonadota bacterium]